MSHLPSSQGSYPPTTMAADPYHKVSLSGSSSFGAESQELPLTASISSVPLPVEQTEQGVRPQYPYMQSTPSASQISGGGDAGMGVHRYGDSSRPTKSSRGAGHQSVHSNGSVANEPTEYRYGAYAPASSSSVGATASGYGSEASAHQSESQREYYAPPSNWTTTSGEGRSTTAYAGGHERSYQPAPHPVKSEPAPGVPHSEYSSTSRGSFDGMNNYSWSGH